MQTYISILRGINVSGQKKILMTDLTKLYEDLGFKDVKSYIQSGNVLFKSSKSLKKKDICDKIQKAIRKQYNFEVPVQILSLDELKAIIESNPFIKQKNIDLEKLHVTFLSESPNPEHLQKTQALDFSPEKFLIKDNAIYLYCPVGYGNSKLSNNFFESKLKVIATTRNWKTVNKLAELAENL